MSQHRLYGDGIHDDTAAIQELIDSGVCEVALPVPKKHYLISKTLEIPSNFKFKLPRFAEIKLADGSNCFMLKNKTVSKPAKRQRDFISDDAKYIWQYYDEFSPEKEDTCHDFEIEGGIWNFNNKNQTENPLYTRKFTEPYYVGYLMLFYNVKNFRISNLTIKDTINYAITLDTASYFTIENIVFDLNDGNPLPTNMDGIHLDGNCHYATIRNIRGACYDDLVALNAYEGSGGDITNINIDGIFAENCHSAVRLLTVQQNVRHIHISNIYGTYYQYGIGITKFFPGETTGCFDAVTIDEFHASKSKRLPIQEVHLDNKRVQFPLIWIQDDTVVKNLTIRGLHRREYENPIDTIRIGRNAIVENFSVQNFTQENHTDTPCLKMINLGKIQGFDADEISEEEIDNRGSIE